MISDVNFQPHTPEDAAARLMEATTGLRAALVTHAAAIVAADGDPEKFAAADEALAPFLIALDEAYTALTDEVHPMRADEVYAEVSGCGGNCACAAGADEDDEAAEGSAEADPTTIVTVHQRHDYAIRDTDALIAAGRAAYLKTSPGSSESDAAEEITDVDLALLHLAHTDGWNNLWQLDGLEAVGGVTAVVPQEAPLSGDPDDWADEVLAEIIADDVEPLFVQVDVYEE